ncbi:MAG: DMT family transporter [Burkholderiales bacterium]|nr:DMT family transporter [Burkholderiales bacterium]
MTDRRRALVLLAFLTLIWGTNWPLFPLAVREVSVWTFRAVAVPVSGLVLLAIAAARGLPLAVPRADWPRLVAATLAYLVVWNIASTYAAVYLPSGQGAVLGFTMPLWAALISWLLLGERLSRRLLVALGLGLAAVALLMVPSFGAYANAPAGLAAGLIAAVGWAVGTLIIKHRPWQTQVLVLTGWQMILTAVPIIAGAAWLGDGRWFMPSWQSIAVIAYITLVPMCIGNVLWFAIVGLLPASVAGLSSIMVPVVAMVSGAIVHGEPLGPLQLAALACCVVSLRLALHKPAASS